MPKTEVDLPDRIDSDITRLVEQGEFLNREQAYEELLKMGISAYGPAEEAGEDPGGELFDQRVNEQQDPAARPDEPEDDYGF